MSRDKVGGIKLSPSQLYKKAKALLKQSTFGTDTDELAIKYLTCATEDLCRQALEPTTYNIDLDASDTNLLLTNVHVELGSIFEINHKQADAETHYSAALQCFPDSVRVHNALAKLHKSYASPASLLLAEEHLLKALASAELILADPDGFLQSNAICASDLVVAQTARSHLALILCQDGRDNDAIKHLTNLGFKYRLGRQVLHYPLELPLTPEQASSSVGQLESDAFMIALEDALPVAVIQHLQQAFGPDAAFWLEHNYGRVGYFSYMHDLTAAPQNSLQQVAEAILNIARPFFPQLAAARYGEFWAHCRLHPSGHQLHFDADDEGVGGVRNPIVSSVLYLTGGIGGPTLVTDQTLKGPLAQKGWLVHPKENRLALFDGKYLHGVIPGRGPSPRPGEHRITLMFAFWEHLICRPKEDGSPGPSQPYPDPATESQGPKSRPSTWQHALPVYSGAWGKTESRKVAPIPVSPIWEPVAEGGVLEAPNYEVCFQGF